ncbi:MAG TPA: protein kinase [Kofleriaceae bacterium]|jgi:serine/threonine-protein kinase
MAGSSDFDVDGEPVEREGHETLLPSVERSVLSRASYVASELEAAASGSVAPLLPADNDETGRIERVDGRPRQARSGDVIGGRYVVEGMLGKGGMGRVLRVRHQALGKAFALKLIKSAIATNPRIRELFYREARLASALAHDNICSIVDFGQDEIFGLFMVMELLEGQTVNAKLRASGRLTPKVACDVMWQVGDAVRFIHGRQILHGDIKTDNIFLVRTPAQRRLAKLLDFGLSRADLRRDDGLDGTPEYLAPERIAGEPASQASDIYAMGVVFFELLTGALPFTGDTKTVFDKQRTAVLPAPSKLLDEPLDERADSIIARATAKDPNKRHPDVPAFMYELRTLMGMLGMEQGGAPRRRALAPDAARERREHDHRVKAGAEVFGSVPLPMASCDIAGRVRAANPAFLEFLGAAGDAGGLELRDSALPEVYPTLFEDLELVATKRAPIKRVIYLNEGGDRVVEAAVVLTAAPSAAEVTAGEVHIVLHPLRALLS